MLNKQTPCYESPFVEFVACESLDILTSSNGFRGAWDELQKNSQP